MEENKELETTTEEQVSVTPAANNGREKKAYFSVAYSLALRPQLLIVGRYLYRFSDPQHHDHEG